MTELGHALTRLDDPPVKAIVVYNSNPAAIAPNQNAVLAGFRREDLFTVVLEQFQNDTADYADILLPATTFLEHTDLYLAYGHYYLQLARPALPGAGRGEVERRGLPGARRADGVRRPVLPRIGRRHDPDAAGLGASVRQRDHARGTGPRELRAAADSRAVPAVRARADSERRTASADFRAGELDYTPPVESRHGDTELRRKYPLELISPKNDDSMNSTFGHRDAVDLQTATLHLHAEDAAARGIQTADQVRVFNDRGSCVLVAEVDETVRPGVVCAPVGALGKARRPGKRNVNALTSERLTDAGGGPTFYSCLVQVERIGD